MSCGLFRDASVGRLLRTPCLCRAKQPASRRTARHSGLNPQQQASRNLPRFWPEVSSLDRPSLQRRPKYGCVSSDHLRRLGRPACAGSEIYLWCCQGSASARRFCSFGRTWSSHPACPSRRSRCRRALHAQGCRSTSARMSKISGERLMQLGMIGLGRMGANIVRRLMSKGHRCVVFDTDAKAREALANEGAIAAGSLAEVVKALSEKPRAVWIMLPAGRITEETVERLGALLERDDIIIDGGNTFYKDDIRRARTLFTKGIRYLDCGTSGGVWGVERGYCMMIGGPDAAFDHCSILVPRRWRRIRSWMNSPVTCRIPARGGGRSRLQSRRRLPPMCSRRHCLPVSVRASSTRSQKRCCRRCASVSAAMPREASPVIPNQSPKTCRAALRVVTRPSSVQLCHVR